VRPTLRRRRRWTLGLLIALTVLVGWIYFGNDLALALESSAVSRSVGTPSHGSLKHGKRLPSTGANFRVYSRLGAALGRNSVHTKVRAVVLEAYVQAGRQVPTARFVYGETGWPSGGRFWPHRTHQNGLSIDFMVPVRTRTGQPAELPTWPWQKFGYAVEFDSNGRWHDLEIDYPAMVAHLSALKIAAHRQGLRIDRVIFAPELRNRFGHAPGGDVILKQVPFMRARPWIRHDEHYHVDFATGARADGR
jgi:penicillin-insensitive murein DD-endopeptidase